MRLTERNLCLYRTYRKENKTALWKTLNFFRWFYISETLYKGICISGIIYWERWTPKIFYGVFLLLRHFIEILNFWGSLKKTQFLRSFMEDFLFLISFMKDIEILKSFMKVFIFLRSFMEDFLFLKSFMKDFELLKFLI